MTNRAGRSDSLTEDQQELAGLLAGTDLTYARIAEHLGLTAGALRTDGSTPMLWCRCGRAALRAHLLECELADGAA